MKEQYVIIGTYPNNNKSAFIVVADNYNDAVKKLLDSSDGYFINIEVVCIYNQLKTIE